MLSCTGAWAAAKYIETPEKRGMFAKSCTENPANMEFLYRET